MEELQDIIVNYSLMRPLICFTAGTAIGTVTRLVQNYGARKDKTYKSGWLYRWLPGGSLATGIVIASLEAGGGADVYVADAGAALAGDYLATRIVDKIYKK